MQEILLKLRKDFTNIQHMSHVCMYFLMYVYSILYCFYIRSAGFCADSVHKKDFFYVSKGTQPVVNSKHIFEVMIRLLIQIRSHEMHNICEIAAQMRKCYQLFVQSV